MERMRERKNVEFVLVVLCQAPLYCYGSTLLRQGWVTVRLSE